MKGNTYYAHLRKAEQKSSASGIFLLLFILVLFLSLFFTSCTSIRVPVGKGCAVEFNQNGEYTVLQKDTVFHIGAGMRVRMCVECDSLGDNWKLKTWTK